ncbi:MAG TPA: hypothetical protein VGQ09_03515 [Chitinophagaceae bacterium]|nr:hypothetical protein [Chitinophagaceae bacterium]
MRRQKSKTLKLAPLLAQYLYEKKKIDLAGIGTFLLDPSARKNPDAQHASEGISFQNNAAVKEDDELISYISAHTGKMKALASSDLNSYLELARQFLNIGKPFQIEGIGTLVKNKSGLFEFTADHLLIDKVKDSGIKELSATSTSDESLTTYESLKPHVEKSPPYKRIFLGVLVVATTALIIWAGYKLYKNNSSTSASEEQQAQETVPATDTVKYVSPNTDTNAASGQKNQTAASNTFRFVIEVANKKRAFQRYAMLKKGMIPIQMSTDDSVSFKLFFVIPATPADTARISDSLTVWYPALNKKKAFAEQ